MCRDMQKNCMHTIIEESRVRILLLRYQACKNAYFAIFYEPSLELPKILKDIQNWAQGERQFQCWQKINLLKGQIQDLYNYACIADNDVPNVIRTDISLYFEQKCSKFVTARNTLGKLEALSIDIPQPGWSNQLYNYLIDFGPLTSQAGKIPQLALQVWSITSNIRLKLKIFEFHVKRNVKTAGASMPATTDGLLMIGKRIIRNCFISSGIIASLNKLFGDQWWNEKNKEFIPFQSNDRKFKLRASKQKFKTENALTAVEETGGRVFTDEGKRIHEETFLTLKPIWFLLSTNSDTEKWPVRDATHSASTISVHNARTNWTRKLGRPHLQK